MAQHRGSRSLSLSRMQHTTVAIPFASQSTRSSSINFITETSKLRDRSFLAGSQRRSVSRAQQGAKGSTTRKRRGDALLFHPPVDHFHSGCVPPFITPPQHPDTTELPQGSLTACTHLFLWSQLLASLASWHPALSVHQYIITTDIVVAQHFEGFAFVIKRAANSSRVY